MDVLGGFRTLRAGFATCQLSACFHHESGKSKNAPQFPAFFSFKRGKIDPIFPEYYYANLFQM
jgi:hypothetical protein